MRDIAELVIDSADAVNADVQDDIAVGLLREIPELSGDVGELLVTPVVERNNFLCPVEI